MSKQDKAKKVLEMLNSQGLKVVEVDGSPEEIYTMVKGKINSSIKIPKITKIVKVDDE